jgi:hypothetical protein
MIKQSLQDATTQASGESNKKALDQMMADVKSKVDGVQAARDADPIEDEEIRRRLLSSLFEVLEAAGVDPNDLDSINKFLMELQEQNPDLYELFRYAFDKLTGEENIAEGEAGAENAGLMGKYANLGPQTMMPPQGMPEMPQGMPEMPGGMPPEIPQEGAPMMPPPASPAGPQMPI